MEEILARPGDREICQQCGEEILNQRYVHQNGRLLCKACAEPAYYTPL
jgi:formylmethanofuran dehydrogenase subunit E